MSFFCWGSGMRRRGLQKFVSIHFTFVLFFKMWFVSSQHKFLQIFIWSPQSALREWWRDAWYLSIPNPQRERCWKCIVFNMGSWECWEMTSRDVGGATWSCRNPRNDQLGRETAHIFVEFFDVKTMKKNCGWKTTPLVKDGRKNRSTVVEEVRLTTWHV